MNDRPTYPPNPKEGRMKMLEELATRCEAATGPDRELDDAIHQVINSRSHPMVDYYTDSLDAATTLVPAGMEWETGSTGWARLRPSGTIDQLDPRVVLVRKAATSALALCAAAIRARATQEAGK